MTRCDVFGCSDFALLLHATGCGSAVCARHAEPFGDCPLCHESFDLAVTA